VSELDQPGAVASRSHRHRRRRRRTRVGLLAIGVVIVLAVLAVLPALGAKTKLETGKDELVLARDLLLAGDVDGAQAAFGRAEAAFDAARGFARSPVLRATGLVPLFGRSTDALEVLAQAGGAAASAGAELTGGVEALPEGIASLAPAGGRLPVEAIAALEPAVASAREELDGALADLEALPTSFLLGPIAEARDQAIAEIGRATDVAHAADALTTALPELIGSDRERRYFVGAQATAELRGTGGLIGAYTILRASDGGLVMEPMRSIHALPDLPPNQAPPPPPGFGEPYARFGGPGFWRNLNMGPDAPTAAAMIEALYEQVTGEHVDGVILVDAQTLAEMLQATGPVTSPTIDRTLEASTVVDYLTNEAYLEFGSEAERKRVLGAAVLAVWTRFLEGSQPIAAFQALADAAAGGHLILHSADPEVQADLEAAGIAGAWTAPTDGNLFGVSVSNADGTKVDYYVHREDRYEVRLAPDGSAAVDSTTSFANDAPVGAEPSYVLGPYPGTGLGVGDSRSFVATYCAPGCHLEDARLDGETAGVEPHSDRGLPVFTTYVRTDAGSSSALELSLSQPDAWTGDELGGTYRVVLRGQPTISPTTTTLVVRVPPGMRIVETSVPMEITGDEATWQGTVGREQTFELRFERPFPERVWTELGNAFSSLF
jgi:hypothetical protein